jgi:hypothetical protein
MSKPQFGLANTLTAEEKIYYENIFSMHQIGRTVDLLCAIASEFGHQTTNLRCALTASLTEACRNQSLHEKAATIGAVAKFISPVSVEFGFNAEKVFAAIGFCAHGDDDTRLGLEQSLELAAHWAESLALRTEKKSGLFEIFLSVPAQATPVPSGLSRVEIGENGEAAGASSSDGREYVELGDVEYTRLLSHAKAPTKKLIDAATQGYAASDRPEPTDSEGEMAEALEKNLSKERKAQVLADTDPSAAAALLRKSLKPEEVEQLIAEELSPREKAKILGTSMEPSEIEKVLHEHLSDEQKAKVLAEGDPQSAATLIKNVVQTIENERIVVKHTGIGDEDSPYDQTISGSFENESETPLSLSLLEEARALAQEEPDTAIAALKKSTTPERLKSMLKKSSLNQETTAQAIVDHLPPEALSKAIIESLSTDEIGKLLTTQMPKAQLMKAITTGMSKEELARAITAALPKEEYARVLSEGLPSREIARALSDGLPKEQFAKLLSAAIPPQKLKVAIAEGQSESGDASFKPEQFELTAEQVEILMSPATTRATAVPILSKVMPPSVARSIFSGEVSQHVIIRALEGFLPNSALAPQVASCLLESLTKEDPAERVAADAEASKDQKIKAGLSGGEQRSKDLNADLSQKFSAKLASSKKAIDFYVARNRSLESQLSALDAQKRAAEREAQLLKAQLQAAQNASRKSAAVAAEISLPKLEEVEYSSDAKAKWKDDSAPDPGTDPLQDSLDSLLDAATDDVPTARSASEIPDAASAAPEASAPGTGRSSDKSSGKSQERSEQELEAELEAEAQKLEQNLQGVVGKIEKIKDAVHENKVKNQIDGMLGEVLIEKAKINELSRELSALFRKKEHSLKVRESSLVEELRQSKIVINQRNSNIERLKEMMVNMQQKMQTESQSSGENAASETQMRVKLEVSRRQIESLKEDIDRLTRRAQSVPSSQQSAVQHREMTELQKQVAVANKALAAKKQEVDLLKRQMAEKETRESELKRSVMRLQNELTAAKAIVTAVTKKTAA